MWKTSFLICLLAVSSFWSTASAQSSVPTGGSNGPGAASTPTGGTTSAVYTRPDADERFHRYLNGMFGPVALAKRVVSSGYGTWRNSPREWGDNWEGFGRRFASGTGKSIIQNTTMYALEEASKLDSRFYKSPKRDTGSKISNALLSPFTARTEEGKRVFGYPRLIGTYTANIVAAETWYPARYDWKDGIKSGTISLGFTAGFNLVKEFIKK